MSNEIIDEIRDGKKVTDRSGTKYEEFVLASCRNPDNDRIQLYLDGMNEEHGEISGAIKRMRRGDFGYKVRMDIAINGLERTLNDVSDDPLLQDMIEMCRDAIIREIGDHHWYMTRFLQKLGLTWDVIEKANMEKINERDNNRE